MDRSFLSDAEVIAASRKFVCIRLTTYEYESEAKFLKSLFTGKSGELENTVFAIFSPDGKKKLMKASRSPRQLFQDATDMAKIMNGVAQQYGGKTNKVAPPLPLVANVRLALDVAACDNQPLVIFFAEKAETRKALQEKLTPLAWSDDFIGRFVFVSATCTKELAPIQNASTEAGVIVVQPDQFGLKGKILQHIGSESSSADISKTLKVAMGQFQPYQKSFKNHVQQGHKLGIFWDTAIPVTDPMEAMAREKGKLSSKPK
jgi:hypothetical protein